MRAQLYPWEKVMALLLPYVLLTPVLVSYYFILCMMPALIVVVTMLSPIIVIILLLEIRQKVADKPIYNVYSYNTIKTEK